MKDVELNSKIKNAFTAATPDVLDSVLSDCREMKGTVIVMKKEKRSLPYIKYFAAAAACLLLVLGGILSFRIYDMNYSIDSTVSLDVNPSIQITANKKERILDVVGLNEDGKKVIGDMDFKGSDLDVAVNAIIGSMLRNGYLNDLANSILISVDNSDPAVSSALQERLTQEVNSLLQTESFTGAVLSQTISDNENLEQLKNQYGITTGKAQLIQEILKNDSLHTFEELVPLSINELNLLMESSATTPENVSTVGTASDKAYIGQDKAKEAALAHAGISAQDVAYFEIDIDTENGVLVYEIEFKANGYEYDYDINALTGDVVKSKKEADDDYIAQQASGSANNNQSAQNSGSAQAEQKPGTAGSTTSSITEQKAKEIAVNHAGQSIDAVTFIKVNKDYDNGIQVYEIEFKYNGFEYDYDINAQNGNIVKSSKEKDDDYVTQKPSVSTGNAASAITEQKAKEIALNHAGISESSVTFIKSKLDYDDGIQVYDVEFHVGSKEYEYEIDASSGNILDYDMDIDD